MSIGFSQKYLHLLFAITTIALVAKIVTLPLFFVLPHTSIDVKPNYTIDLYKRYDVVRAFGLVGKRVVHRPKKPIYRLTNVKLKAIYSEGKSGVIAIEEKGKLIFLSTGESFKGYKLIEVKPDSAIFEKDGKHYELRLQEKNLKDRYSIQEPEFYNPDEVKFAVLKRDIDRFKRNFAEIWKNISIQEQIDPKTKRLTGFKVTRINKNSIFGKIGLQKGDIIIGANDKIFRSYSDVFRLYNKIDKYNSIKITILRNNQKKDLEYEIY